MSFKLLKAKVIDTNICIHCGLCAKSCKHIVMADSGIDDGNLIPKLKSKCIMETKGLSCGNCYDNCPIVRAKKKKNPEDFLNTRERVLKIIVEFPNKTITNIAKIANLTTIKVRYEALRLVELDEVEFNIPINQWDPVFSKIIQ